MLRVDLNVAKGESWRMKAILPTIEHITELASSVTVISHLGRPKGKVLKDLSLMPLKSKLPKDIELLENLRFDPRENKNDLSLAKELAEGKDVFVNDAFSASHRKHSSIVSLPKLLPSCLGPLFKCEIEALSKDFERPMVMVLGGAKVNTKLPLVKSFLESCDHVLLGGLIANAILDEGIDITSTKMHLPVDAVTMEGSCGVGSVKSYYDILDIGPDSVELFREVLKQAKTIIWNGPMGKFEDRRFRQGTLDLVKVIAGVKATKIVGGGESVDIIDDLNLESKFDHISSGGGAMLQFLANGTLPGIEAIKKSERLES